MLRSTCMNLPGWGITCMHMPHQTLAIIGPGRGLHHSAFMATNANHTLATASGQQSASTSAHMHHLRQAAGSRRVHVWYAVQHAYCGSHTPPVPCQTSH